MDDEPKFCVTCIWHTKHYDGYDAWSECNRRLSDRRGLVSGEYNHVVSRSCASERRSDKSIFGRIRCGPKALFYESVMETAAARSKGGRSDTDGDCGHTSHDDGADT